jgi:hypothetical protein
MLDRRCFILNLNEAENVMTVLFEFIVVGTFELNNALRSWAKAYLALCR